MRKLIYSKGEHIRFRSKVMNGPAIGEIIEIHQVSCAYSVELSGGSGQEFVVAELVMGKVLTEPSE